MSATEKRTELFVGLFVFFGLAIMAVLILQFGRFGDRMRESYALSIKFDDATGIFDNVDVRLGGVKIGTVNGKPHPDPSLRGVLVDLTIFTDFQIPRNSAIRIRTAGLMGDSYISVDVPDNPSSTHFEPGEKIEGVSGGDLAALTDTAEQLSEQARILMKELTETVADVRNGIDNLNSALNKFDNDILGDENLENVKETIANFKTLSDNLSEASVKLGPAIDEIRGAVHNANGAFEGAQEIVLQLQPVIDDLEKAAGAMNDGDGLLNALLSDAELRADFIALIANLKEHGVLRYKDTATADRPAAAAEAAPRTAPTEKKSWKPFGRTR